MRCSMHAQIMRSRNVSQRRDNERHVREAVARHILARDQGKGHTCTADNIVLSNGTRDVSLAIQLLLRSELDCVLVPSLDLVFSSSAALHGARATSYALHCASTEGEAEWSLSIRELEAALARATAQVFSFCAARWHYRAARSFWQPVCGTRSVPAGVPGCVCVCVRARHTLTHSLAHTQTHTHTLPLSIYLFLSLSLSRAHARARARTHAHTHRWPGFEGEGTGGEQSGTGAVIKRGAARGCQVLCCLRTGARGR